MVYRAEAGLASIAGAVEELELQEWDRDLEDGGVPGGPIDERLKGQEELGRDLKIRTGQGMVISGPSGTVGALGGYGGFYCFALTP